MENKKGKLILITILVMVLLTALGYFIAFNVVDTGDSEEIKDNKNTNVENNIESEDNSVSVNTNENKNGLIRNIDTQNKSNAKNSADKNGKSKKEDDP